MTIRPNRWIVLPSLLALEACAGPDTSRWQEDLDARRVLVMQVCFTDPDYRHNVSLMTIERGMYSHQGAGVGGKTTGGQHFSRRC